MTIVKKYYAYITPEKGEGMLTLAKKIHKEIKDGTLRDGIEKIYLNLPGGAQIEISGDSPEAIRDSIATQWNGDPVF